MASRCKNYYYYYCRFFGIAEKPENQESAQIQAQTQAQAESETDGGGYKQWKSDVFYKVNNVLRTFFQILSKNVGGLRRRSEQNDSVNEQSQALATLIAHAYTKDVTLDPGLISAQDIPYRIETVTSYYYRVYLDELGSILIDPKKKGVNPLIFREFISQNGLQQIIHTVGDLARASAKLQSDKASQANKVLNLQYPDLLSEAF